MLCSVLFERTKMRLEPRKNTKKYIQERRFEIFLKIYLFSRL